MKLLGIDYGEKTVGIAISEGSYADALAAVPTGDIDTQLKRLRTMYNITACVIGIPGGRLRPKVMQFISHLEKELDFKMIAWDETLSTHEATQRLLNTQISRKNRQLREHQVAAALILQSYLDAQTHEK